MFESDDKRARRDQKAPLLSVAAGSATESIRDLDEGPAEPPSLSSTPAGTAAERHQRARSARRIAEPNPLLASLASQPQPAREDGAIDREIADFIASTETAEETTIPAAEEPRRDPPRSRRPVVAVSRSAVQSDYFEPLIDPAMVGSTLWNWRLPIAGLTLAGLLLGVAVALTTPPEYTSYAQILVDPREVKLVGRDITPDYLANEAALAIVDSQLELVRSSSVLGKVVERAKLDQDPEFNGRGESFGLLDSLRGFASIFTEGDGADDRGRSAIQTLRDNLWAERAARTFVINVGVTTRNPEKSTLLANELTKAFVEEQERLHSETARDATDALTGRLASLRADVEKAENALEAYKAENGLVGPAGRLVTDDQLSAVTTQLSEARGATIAAKSRAEAARGVDLDAVLSGGLPPDLNTAALTALRAQYATQRQQVAALENSLGSRHPKLADARASLQSLESEIRAELRRIVAGTQSDLRRSVENEQALAASLAELKAASVNEGDAAVGLRELEREATAARDVYESFLLRARETGEIEAMGTTNVKVISPAETPQEPSSLSRKLIVAGYGVGGFVLGLALALLAALRQVFFGGREDDGPEPGAPRRRTVVRDAEVAETPSRGAHDAGAAVAAVRMAAEAEAANHTDEFSADERESENEMYPYQHPHPYYPAPDQQAAAPQHWQQWQAPMQPMPGWPAPQGWGYPAPMAYGYPPMPHPAAMPYVPQPPLSAAPQAAPQPADRPEEALAAGDEAELEELRQSVREIRDTLDVLIRRRAGRGRRVA